MCFTHEFSTRITLSQMMSIVGFTTDVESFSELT